MQANKWVNETLISREKASGSEKTNVSKTRWKRNWVTNKPGLCLLKFQYNPWVKDLEELADMLGKYRMGGEEALKIVY